MAPHRNSWPSHRNGHAVGARSAKTRRAYSYTNPLAEHSLDRSQGHAVCKQPSECSNGKTQIDHKGNTGTQNAAAITKAQGQD